MTSDWWSVGAILYEMLTGSPGPFQSKANEGIQIVQMLKSDNCKLAIQGKHIVIAHQAPDIFSQGQMNFCLNLNRTFT